MATSAALKPVQYLTDPEGRRTGVLLDIRAWESLLRWLEDATDAQAAANALQEIQDAGGIREAGLISWDDAREDWGGHSVSI